MESKYNCDKCNFHSNIHQNYKNHLLSIKHKKENPEEQNTKTHKCKTCDKVYKSLSGLWYHKKTCKPAPIIPPNETQQLKEELKEIKELILDFAKKEPSSIMINSQNKNNFNINIFLNEECKNAINMVEFMKNLSIELNDMLKIGQEGYVNGATQIIQKNLKRFPIYERPIHYYVNDKSTKNSLHIKDENDWKEEESARLLLDKSIYEMDKKIERTHSKIKHANREPYTEISTELYTRGSLGKQNCEEQEEILNNIIPAVKVPPTN